VPFDPESMMKMVNRTVMVPLEFLPDEQWREVRRLAYQCAQYGNWSLSASYARAKGVVSIENYKESSDTLSAAIRDAVGRECVGIWRRLGKKILRGETTCARFSVGRGDVTNQPAVKRRGKRRRFQCPLGWAW
jgi:hypothetical protein